MRHVLLALFPLLFLNQCLLVVRKAMADDEIRQITINEKTRRYLLHIPATYQPGKKVPLVVILHGGGGNGRNAESMSHFSEFADREGFLALYPYGTGRLLDEKLLTWNAGNCCGHALDKNVDDVGYIRQLILFIKNQYSINDEMVFVTGMSNGGMMTYRIACELSGYVTGIAPVSGAMNVSSCSPAKPLSVIIFHGRNDRHVRYEGGVPEAKRDSHDRVDSSVSYAENFWKEQNACTDRRVEKKGKVERVTYTCAKGELSVVSIDGEGHTWPGGSPGHPGADQPTTEVNATEEMYRFWMKK